MTMHVRCFFFNDTATTEIYTLSLHDALPIYPDQKGLLPLIFKAVPRPRWDVHQASCADGEAAVSKNEGATAFMGPERSEEHTSELQSTPISRMSFSA